MKPKETKLKLTEETPKETPTSENSRYPLLPLQKGILFHSNTQANFLCYINQVVIELPEAVQSDALELAVQTVMSRHDILRAFIDELYLELIVEKELTISLQATDFSNSDTQKDQLQRWLDQDKATVFDLSKPPLIRFNLLKLAENNYLFVITYHHMLMGATSTIYMVKEIVGFYDNFLNHTKPQIDQPLAYEKCLSLLQWDEMPKAEAYWSELLNGYEQVTRLPQFGLKYEDTAQMGQEPFTLNCQVYENLKTFAKKHHTTINILLQTGWALLLAHYCNSNDIVFGVTREFPRKLTKNTLGLFLNTLPVRLQCQKDKTIEDFITELKQQHRKQIRYVYTPLAAIQACCELPAGSSLFSTLFDFKRSEPNRIMQKLYAKWKPRKGTFRFDTHYPLSIEAYEEESSLHINLHFNSALFEKAFVQQLMKHYEHLLRQLSIDIKQKALGIPLLTLEERQALIEWNDTKADYPKDKTVHALFSSKARVSPNNVAASYKHHSITYQALDEQSDALAFYLKNQGVKVGTPVVLCVERSLSLLVGIISIMKAGGYYIPIDPNYPGQRIATILQDCGSEYVLTQDVLSEKIERYLNLFSLKVNLISLDNKNNYINFDKTSQHLNHSNPDDTVYAIYTSGSTGKPKGVANSHRSLVNRLIWMQKQYQLTEYDRVLHKTSIGFDVSFWELFWPLITGSQVVLAPVGAEQDVAELARVIQQMKITRLHFVPSALQTFLSIPGSVTCSSLKQIFCSGEILPLPLMQGFFKKFPTVRLSNLYGPTEAAIDVTYWDCRLSDKRKTVPIGKPIANSKLYVVNAHDQVVGSYLMGELYIGGIPLARGYLNRSDLTNEKFIKKDALGSKERLYKTGDIVRWMPDGNLEYLWRIDDQIKLRGFRIELGEIEQLLTQCPLIKKASALVRGNDLNRHIAIYFSANHPVDIEAIRLFLSERLPAYMLPAVYQQIAQFPLNKHGKIDKDALSLLELSDVKLSKSELINDGDFTKQTVIEAWRKFLNLSASSPIYEEDNFFNLGGNSLTAIQVATYINTKLALSIRPIVLFDYPILGKLIEYSKLHVTVQGQEALSIEPTSPRPEKIPLSFAQQRLWFLDQLYPDQTSYNLFIALKITGDLDINALQQAFNALLQRHEILRTTFCSKGGEVFQVIHNDIDSAMMLHPLNNTKEQVLYKKIYEEAQTPFNLEKGPLIRASLLLCNKKEHILLLTLHHIICDGWSMSVLGKELSSLYVSIKENRYNEMKPVEAIQYADYALWSRKQLTDKWLEPQIAYWKKQLFQVPLLNLPTDYARPTLQQFKGKRLAFQLDAAITEGIKKLATEGSTTLFSVFVSAFDIILARYSGQQDIALGTPIAGRQYRGAENIIGLFVNTLVLRTQLDMNDNFIDLVKKNHGTLKSAYANQDVPFEKLVEHLLISRDMSHHPLCQVMIVMQNFDVHSLQLPGTEIARVFSDNDTLLLSDYESSKFDLTLYLQEKEGAVSGLFEYNTSLFKESTLKRFSQHFIQLLSSLIEFPKTPVLCLPLLTPQEQRQLLLTYNNTEQDYPQDLNVVRLFEEQVEKTPEQTAVLFKEQKITYRTLNESANQLAHYLRLQNISRNSLVGIYLDRSMEMVISILAILKAGSAYVPIDTCLPEQRSRYIVEDSKVSLILTSKIYKEKLKAISNTLTDIVVLEELQSDFGKLSKSNSEHLIRPDDFSYVIYTSGSTGKPKGVANQHRGTLNRLAWMNKVYSLTPDDRILQKTSLSFDVSVWEILWPLITGSVVVLAEPGMHKDVDYLMEITKNKKITLMHFVPSMLSSFLDYDCSDKLDSLKHIFMSGEMLTPKLQQQFFDRFKHISLHNFYGPTEASIDVTYWRCAPNQRVVPIGKPITNTKIYITDRYMNLVPVGVIGEICIAGDGVAWGYLNQEQLTQEKFVKNPFDSGKYARLYRTGDLGRWLADGSIEYIDRIDRQMKIRGFRVEPAEIEATLLEHASVNQVAVIQETGASSQQLIAYLIIDENKKIPNFEALFHFLKQRLPDYMIPTSFTVLEKMPLTQSGKIDWRHLPLAKAKETIASSKAIVSAENNLQKKLIEIWSKHLNVNDASIGIHHDFFELGGHSLLALKIISAIQTVFEVKINTRDFFISPTIGQLSQLIKQKLLEKTVHKNNLTYITRPNSPLINLQPEGNKTPIFLLHPVGGTVFCYMPLVSYLRKDRPCYAIQDPGIEAGQPLYGTIQEMTTDYLRIVKTVQPEGPYILGGSSFGGTAAVEMAHQLNQAGEKVAFLAGLDSWALFTDEFRSRKRLETTMLRQFELLKKRLNTEDIPDPEPWLELNWHRLNLWLNYNPPILDTKITVFKAAKLMPEYIPIDDPANHWQQYSTYPVEAYRVPGDHETMHLEPQVQVLARQIQICLDDLQDHFADAIVGKNLHMAKEVMV